MSTPTRSTRTSIARSTRPQAAARSLQSPAHRHAHRHEPRLAFRPAIMNRFATRPRACSRARSVRPHRAQVRLPRFRFLDEVEQPEGHDHTPHRMPRPRSLEWGRTGITRCPPASRKPATRGRSHQSAHRIGALPGRRSRRTDPVSLTEDSVHEIPSRALLRGVGENHATTVEQPARQQAYSVAVSHQPACVGSHHGQLKAHRRPHRFHARRRHHRHVRGDTEHKAPATRDLSPTSCS